MPANWSMFKRRAEHDPDARGKRGMAKSLAGWKPMLRDDQDAFAGRTSFRDWWRDRQRLRG